jgi:sec-independent protein translocase protein TatA
MFGIGGGELVFILLIALMLFGSDKIPDIARMLGKGMAQLKNASNEIKTEIQKSAEANGIDKSITDLSSNFSSEVDKIKGSLDPKLANPIEKVKEEIDDIVGPIKRQF